MNASRAVLLCLSGLMVFLSRAWRSRSTWLATSDSSVETVIVTAPKWLEDKPQTIIHNFVRSYAMAATPTVGEIARWKFGICTRTYGLSKPEYNAFVTKQVEDIAMQAGLSVKQAPCHYSVEIVFTATPQDFLDRVHQIGAQLLGPKPSQAAANGTMRYPIQAWYATGTRDIYGQIMLDDEDSAAFGPPGLAPALSGVPFENVEGLRWRTGLNSELAHIYVVADTGKTQNLELGAVADYVAMLALSQTQNFDACKPIPSITNLISPACGGDLKQGNHRQRPGLSEGRVPYGPGREFPAAAEFYRRPDRCGAGREMKQATLLLLLGLAPVAQAQPAAGGARSVA